MKRWMTISEIASAGLPGLPASARGVAKMAATQGWAQRAGQARKRKGRGGGMEFAIEVLPKAALAALLSREADMATESVQPPSRSDDVLQGAERDRRDARLWVLTALDDFAAANGIGITDAAALFPDAWNTGLIEAPELVRLYVPTTSRARLFAWRALRRDQCDDALGLDLRGRPTIIETAVDGQAAGAALGAIAKQPFLSASQLHEYLSDRFGDDLRATTVRTWQRARRRLEDRHRNALLAVRDPDRYRSTVEHSATASTRAFGLNDLWQIDASPADVMLLGKRRHSIYACIDIWSRRTLIMVTETPRAAAVAMLLRAAILAWGVPRRIKTDNGSDFTAHAIARLFTALGIEWELSAPYDPKSKGNVERVIGTFQRDLATCPGFIGHSVADRKVIENRKAFSKRLGMDDAELFDVQMDLPEFQAWCDKWASEVYATRPHSALGRGMTPMLKAASWPGDVARIEDTHALDILLAPIAGKDGVRTVTKQGLRIGNEYYQTAAAWPGDEVLVRMDPADLGRALVFSLSGDEYLGEAVCPHLAGLDPVAVTMQVKAAQKSFMAEETGRIRREMKKIGPRDFADAMLREGARRAAKITAFERPATSYTTPALQAAQAASGQSAKAPAPDYDPAEMQRQLGEVVKISRHQKPAPAAQPDAFRRAIDLEEAIARGEAVTDSDRAWLTSYQQHPDYRGARRIYDKQGRAMFG